MSDPFSYKEGQCDECGDTCVNLVKEGDPITDCFCHIEDGDIRYEARKMKLEYEAELSKVRFDLKVSNEVIKRMADTIAHLEVKLFTVKNSLVQIVRATSESIKKDGGIANG